MLCVYPCQSEMKCNASRGADFNQYLFQGNNSYLSNLLIININVIIIIYHIFPSSREVSIHEEIKAEEVSAVAQRGAKKGQMP